MDQKTELLVKHLELIQNIIVRMANNSFMIKGWSTVIISALLALDATATNFNLVYVAYLPAITFWILDGYFLSQERYFRRLYDKVREQLITPDISEAVEPFSMAASRFAKLNDNWFRILWSRTLIIFHGTILILISLIVVFLRP